MGSYKVGDIKYFKHNDDSLCKCVIVEVNDNGFRITYGHESEKEYHPIRLTSIFESWECVGKFLVAVMITKEEWDWSTIK